MVKVCVHRFIGRDGECVLCGYLPERVPGPVRCDRHFDSLYPVRCFACDALEAEYRELNIIPKEN